MTGDTRIRPANPKTEMASTSIWPIFVISLPDAYERRKSLTRDLTSRGLDFGMVDAIDGRRVLPSEYERKIDRKRTVEAFGRPLADAEYACAFSHLSVYHKISEDNLPGAIILEDDAILTPLFDEFLTARGFECADLVQLDHLHGDIWRGHSPIQLTPNIRLAMAARNTSLTTGYSISNRGARYFLEEAFPLTRPADWPADPLVVGAMLAMPRIVDHPPFSAEISSIEPLRAPLISRKTAWERSTRFFYAAYWRRWWFKRCTRRIS